MKPVIYMFSMLLLSACSTGQVSEVIDPFSGERTKTLDIGQIKSENAFGLMYEIRCRLFKLRRKDNSEDYFFKFYTYSESDGESCPNVKKDSKAIFLVDGKSIELKTSRDSLVTKGMRGFLALGCMESDIDVGPISKELLSNLLNQNEIKFRIYGSRFNLTGIIDKDDIQMMKNFVK